MSEHDASAPVPQIDISQLKVHHITDSASGVEQNVENGIGSDVLSEFEFPKQSTDLSTFESLWRKKLTADLLDLLGRVDSEGVLFDSPFQKSTDGNQRPIDGGNCLSFLSMEMIAKIDKVPDRQSTQREYFTIRLIEPPHQFPQIISDCSVGVRREIMTAQVLVDETTDFWIHPQPRENIIGRILMLI